MPKPYKLRWGEPGVIRLEDGAVIMPDVGGFNWQTYLTWMYAGNEPDPADQPSPNIAMLSKMVIVNRLSNAEAEAIEAARPFWPAKDRLVWEAASEIDPSHSSIRSFLTNVIGEERMQEVLRIGP